MATSALGRLRAIHHLALDRRVALPFFVVVAVAFTSTLYRRPMNLGHGDWIWFHFIWDSARKTYVDFGEIPWWNPYYCGGNFGVANGQSFSLSPLFLLLLPFPTALAMKLYLTTLTFVGLWGTYELTRRFQAKSAAAVVAAVLFGCSGFLGWHMNGQTGMAALEVLPWVIYFHLRGIERPVFAPLAGAALAFMVVSSGIYPAVITTVAIVLHVIVASLPLDPARRLLPRHVVRSGALTGVSCFAFSAPKLLPLADYLRDHARPIATDDRVGWPLILDALIVKRTTETQIWPHVGYAYAWWGEYGNYVGWTGIVLTVVALLGAFPRRRREIALALLALGVVLGDHGPWSPYALLRSVPGLRNLRVPTRYWIVVDVWAACVLAFGLDRVTRLAIVRLRGALRLGVVLLLVAASAFLSVDMIRTNGMAVFSGAMPTPPAPPNRGPGELHQVAGEPWGMYRYPPQNLGSLRCFDELTVDISPALRANLPHEIYLDDPGAGRVDITRFSPSEWRAHVELARDAVLVLNQNFFRGWSVEGATSIPYRGLVAAHVDAGTHDVVLRYRPRGYLLGSALFFTMLALTIGWLLVDRRRQARPARPSS